MSALHRTGLGTGARVLLALVGVSVVAGVAGDALATGTEGAATAAHADAFLDLQPGSWRGDVETTVRGAGHRPAALGPRAFSIDAPVLRNVYELQTVVFEFNDFDRLTTVRVIIDPGTTASGVDVLRLYADVRGELVGRFGRPAWERSEGSAPGSEVLFALSSGNVARYLQWENGRTVRAGIPRRLDGRVRVEVVVTGDSLPRSFELWGADTF